MTVEGPASPQSSGADEPRAPRATSEEQSEAGDPQAESTPAAVPAPPRKKKKKKKDKGIGSSRGIETMFRATYRVHMDLTALADSKANIMISINGLILSIILASVAPKIDSNNWLLVPTTVVLLSCLLAIIFAVLSARPRINSSFISLEDIRAGRVNVLFFGNYSSLSEEDFVTGLTDLAQTPDLLYKTMMRDLYGIGRVLNKKFALLRRSYMVFMYGLSISVLAFILVFIMQAFAPQV